MKKILIFTVILIALTACTTLQVSTSEPPATALPQVEMPNPASAYCKQNGYTLEIRTADDGSQSGVCVFPGGSTCDEWAYYRGECGPTPAATVIPTEAASGGGPGENNPGSFITPGTTEAIVDWWGVIESTETGAQYDDYFERRDLGQIILFGIDSKDPEVQSQIEELRDSGKIVHLYGTLVSNVPDYNESQILVERIEVE